VVCKCFGVEQQQGIIEHHRVTPSLEHFNFRMFSAKNCRCALPFARRMTLSAILMLVLLFFNFFPYGYDD